MLRTRLTGHRGLSQAVSLSMRCRDPLSRLPPPSLRSLLRLPSLSMCLFPKLRSRSSRVCTRLPRVNSGRLTQGFHNNFRPIGRPVKSEVNPDNVRIKPGVQLQPSVQNINLESLQDQIKKDLQGHFHTSTESDPSTQASPPGAVPGSSMSGSTWANSNAGMPPNGAASNTPLPNSQSSQPGPPAPASTAVTPNYPNLPPELANLPSLPFLPKPPSTSSKPSDVSTVKPSTKPAVSPVPSISSMPSASSPVPSYPGISATPSINSGYPKVTFFIFLKSYSEK